MSGDDIWSRLGELSDDELGTLIVAAQHVIASDAGDAIEYLSMPVGVAAGAIAASLGTWAASVENSYGIWGASRHAPADRA